MKLLKIKTKQSKWDEEFIKKYRLPREFGGDSPITEREAIIFTWIGWGILFCWIGMMIMIAFH